MERPVGYADAVARFAQSLMQKEVDEHGQESREDLLSSMFDGNMKLLYGDVSFEEMFLAFDEEIMRRTHRKIVQSISDKAKKMKGKKSFFW